MKVIEMGLNEVLVISQMSSIWVGQWQIHISTSAQYSDQIVFTPNWHEKWHLFQICGPYSRATRQYITKTKYFMNFFNPNWLTNRPLEEVIVIKVVDRANVTIVWNTKWIWHQDFVLLSNCILRHKSSFLRL